MNVPINKKIFTLIIVSSCRYSIAAQGVSPQSNDSTEAQSHSASVQDLMHIHGDIL